MAYSLAISKATCHARSISLPSRSHPLSVSVEDHLRRLKASEASSSSSVSSICHNLGSLKDLYECVNDFLQLPLTQQALSQEQQGKWAEEVLDGSLRLLDACGTGRDTLVQMKESVQELESSIRRRRRGECGLANEVGAYMISRKKINKTVSKCILNLKRSEKASLLELLDKDSNLVPIISMFREVEAITLSVLKSLLSYASGTQARSKQSGWSLVYKIVQKKRISCDVGKEADTNEVQKMDGVLYTFNTQKSSKDTKVVQAQNVLKQLGKIEVALQELEEGLEPILRCLVKLRVCLLNALNY